VSRRTSLQLSQVVVHVVGGDHPQEVDVVIRVEVGHLCVVNQGRALQNKKQNNKATTGKLATREQGCTQRASHPTGGHATLLVEAARARQLPAAKS
jgi:GTP cyclohydrolase I